MRPGRHARSACRPMGRRLIHSESDIFQPMICSISKSLISVRVSMLHFFERLCSRDNVIWNSSATYVFSYYLHVTWLANRKHFCKARLQYNFSNRGHFVSRFSLIMSSPTIKQACTRPFHTSFDKLLNKLSIWLGNGEKLSQYWPFLLNTYDCICSSPLI